MAIIFMSNFGRTDTYIIDDWWIYSGESGPFAYHAHKNKYISVVFDNKCPGCGKEIPSKVKFIIDVKKL